MTAAQYLEALALKENAGMDDVEKRFLEVVKERVQAMTESYDEAAVAAEEQWLRGFHDFFFQYTIRWAGQKARERTEKDSPDAAKLKADAKATIEALQKNIAAFALCYMHINRYVTLLRDEIKKEEIRTGISTPKNIKWTADAGIVIARYKKQQKQLVADNARLRAAREAMEMIEKDMISTRGALTTLFGREESEVMMRRIVASLRIADFRRARVVLKELIEAKKKFNLDAKAAAAAEQTLMETGARLIETASSYAKELAGPDNRLFLRPIEVDIAWNSQVLELRKIKAFLAKHHLPYMQYKVDALFHLKDKLMVLGSHESLVILYKRLVTGLAAPLNDIRTLRLYENEVVERVKWLLEGQFQEVPKILERAREAVAEFREGSEEFREIAALHVEEVAIADSMLASGTDD